VECWDALVDDKCFGAFRQRNVTFQDSVREFRYEPSTGRFPSISIGRVPSKAPRKEGVPWRASTTLTGEKYFYTAGKHEGCCEALEESARRGSRQLDIGDELEVFSHSEQVWCRGYIERRSEAVVGVAFQLPGAAAAYWIKKELPLGHPDLRGLDGSPLPFPRLAAVAGPDARHLRGQLF